jgi:hypothetical protein
MIALPSDCPIYYLFIVQISQNLPLMSHVDVMFSMSFLPFFLVIQMWLPFGAVSVSVASTSTVQLSTPRLFRAKPFREPVSNSGHFRIQQFNTHRFYLSIGAPSERTQEYSNAILLAHPSHCSSQLLLGLFKYHLGTGFMSLSNVLS